MLAFGAGALISAVSFDLVEEGSQLGDPGTVGDRPGDRRAHLLRARPRRSTGPGPRAGGTALALGAFLDGIPEQMVLGIGLATGEGVSVGLLVAIFVSNLPEAIGSATDMRASGRSPAVIRRLWIAVAVICTLATVGGYALADSASDNLRAIINGFAAGALLVMLIDSMIPEASEKTGRPRGW